jgi:hypothetical protein
VKGLVVNALQLVSGSLSYELFVNRLSAAWRRKHSESILHISGIVGLVQLRKWELEREQGGKGAGAGVLAQE